MSTESKKPVILLDFWGVIGVVQSPETVAAMAERIGAPTSSFSDAYWRYREAHDAGGSASEFWNRVAAELGVGVDEATTSELVRMDVRSWSGVHSDMLRLIEDLKQAGYRLALLSNAPSELVAHASEVLEGLVAERFFSCQLGVAKPHPRAYQMALEQVAVAASDVIFIDDNCDNVTAALELGMRAFQHVSVSETEAQLS